MVKGQDTCSSAAYMSQTQEQQRFTISEVAADWYELYTELILISLILGQVTVFGG